MTNPRFLIGIVHFFSISCNAGHTDLRKASSVGNDILVLVYFRILPLRFSIRLAV